MSLLVRIEIIIEDVLQWEQEFSEEQEVYINKRINSFKYKLEQYLHYNINGYHQINSTFNYNPIKDGFKLVECESPFVHHIHNALSSELKNFK